jgi:hypothetical protein
MKLSIFNLRLIEIGITNASTATVTEFSIQDLRRKWDKARVHGILYEVTHERAWLDYEDGVWLYYYPANRVTFDVKETQ